MRFKFTVFTATFNRAHTLTRLRDSLAAQSLQDFELLVVDDGSTDDTRELIDRLRREATFAIRYMYQENAGKHVAFDRGVDEARGDLFLPVDSDDALVPNALARLSELWSSLPQLESANYAGVTAACQTPDGRLVGPRLPKPVLDCSALDAVFRWGVTGERFGFQRTEILRQIRFPIGRQLRFVPEGVLWFAIARKFITRFVDEPLRVYYTDGDDRLTTSALERQGPGLAYFGHEVLRNYSDFALANPLVFTKAAIHYQRFRNLLPDGILPNDKLPFVARLFMLATAGPALFLNLRTWVRRGRAR